MNDFSEEYVGESIGLLMETGFPEYDRASLLAQQGVIASTFLETSNQDDRYPGSFFRIPGTPIPGKTTWSIN